jgi:RHS repeat-associated protein
MTMPGRKYSQPNTTYRYGFNGKENDNEVKGEGNQIDFGARIYDSRIGKFLSVDRLQKKNSGESPYLYTGGNPLAFIDVDGNDRIYFNSNGVEIKREVSKIEFITYVQIADKTRDIQVHGVNMVEHTRTFAIAPMPGVVSGYENPAYQKNDYQLAASTFLFNKKLAVAKEPSEITNAARKSHSLVGEFPKHIDVNLVKVWTLQESSGGTNKSQNGLKDITQVNFSGDWAKNKEAKTAIGLTKNMSMTPGISLDYGLKYLFQKGFGSDGVNQNPYPQPELYLDKWSGAAGSWLNAVKNYNGDGAARYGQDYFKMIQDKLNSIKPAQSSNYVAPETKTKSKPNG